MASTLKVTTQWDGFPGAPGFTVWHFGPGGGTVTEAVDAATAASRTFWDAIKARFVSAIKFTVSPEVPELDTATGHLLNVWTATTAPAVVSGTAVSAMAQPTGCSISWLTGTVRGTSRFRGRTFLVPLSVSCYDTDGTLDSAFMTNVNSAATALRTVVAAPLQVLGLPTTPGGSDGVARNVTGHQLRDRVSVLTTRRSR